MPTFPSIVELRKTALAKQASRAAEAEADMRRQLEAELKRIAEELSQAAERGERELYTAIDAAWSSFVSARLRDEGYKIEDALKRRVPYSVEVGNRYRITGW